MTLPWAPLLTLSRTSEPEITLYGAIAISTSPEYLLTLQGNSEAVIWSRSLLKPWQILAWQPVLSKVYPWLTGEHWAVMMGSIMGEPDQIHVVDDMLLQAGLSESDLTCPACYPMSSGKTDQLKASDQSPSSRYHPCVGKHIAALMWLKAQSLSLVGYDHKDSAAIECVDQLLKSLLGLTYPIPLTTDGCGMINWGLTPSQATRLLWLWGQDRTTGSEILQQALADHPNLMGGSGRLDSRFLSGDILTVRPALAKEAADGILGLSFAPNPTFPEGLGLFIKLASGYQPEHLERLIRLILNQLGADVSPMTEASGVIARLEFTPSLASNTQTAGAYGS